MKAKSDAAVISAKKHSLIYCAPVLQKLMQFIALKGTLKQPWDESMMDICLHSHLSYIESGSSEQKNEVIYGDLH